MFTNFFDIEFKYNKCKLMFIFKSLLFKHFKRNCTKQSQAEVQTSIFLVFYLFIIKFGTIVKTINFGYLFKK